MPTRPNPTTTARPAHTIKPGDEIAGRIVFDFARATFGGYYIPMTDGTRVEIKSLETIVHTN